MDFTQRFTYTVLKQIKCRLQGQVLVFQRKNSNVPLHSPAWSILFHPRTRDFRTDWLVIHLVTLQELPVLTSAAGIIIIGICDNGQTVVNVIRTHIIQKCQYTY